MNISIESVTTLGQLKQSGWKSMPVKDEIRKNLISKLKNKETVFEGIYGYEKTVIPQIEHAILAKHDIILLGLRGQAKTKILRMLSTLLDEYIPIVSGSDINDDPFHPLSKFATDTISAKGDETPIEWLHRSKRYGEKLATPDTTVSDLIGDIDPIKAAAKKLTLADHNVINFGLIPRANRGIFVINELPDLQPRIQVALLNIMQERDIQIRGFNIRIPLDVFIAFSANPEDYTNRGNIITPLKDRIDAQIITHYPKNIDVGMQITKNESWQQRTGDWDVYIPEFYRRIVEYTAFEARNSEFIDQKSGVSARMTISALDQMVSSAERRCIITGDRSTTLRVSDLFHSVPALTGKMELVYEGQQEGAINVAKHLLGKALSICFSEIFAEPKIKNEGTRKEFKPILDWFAAGNESVLSDEQTNEEYCAELMKIPGLKDCASTFLKPSNEQELSAGMELILEALHQKSMLSKQEADDKTSYADMAGSVFGSLGDIDSAFDEDEDY